MVPRSRTIRFFLFLALAACVAALAHPLWFPLLGKLLIHDDGPANAEIVVVLAGDYSGRRIEKAAELIRAGYAPAALISGPAGQYGVDECDLAIPFIVHQGYPAEWFIPFPNRALSTREEMIAIVPELRRRHIRSFLLVTSDYHTARAARLFRAATQGSPSFRVIPAPDKYFHADSWWRSREGQKTVFFEWSKTLAAAVGM